ncbi:MAG: Calx-beta domain-containing protein [Planctomycetaceae bacterium]
MLISPWNKLSKRFSRSQSIRRRQPSETAVAVHVELLEDKVLLSADMASFFGLGTSDAPSQSYTVIDPEVESLITADGETLFFDPLVQFDTTSEFEAAPGDGTFWNDFSAFDLEKTFELQSNPGASHTIYLDFNGHVTTGTAWNTFSGMQTITSPAYDFDGNVDVFTDEELVEIQKIWARVAEDFVPFDVNVTTLEPVDLEDLKKISIDGVTPDTRWGVRVVIGDDAMNTGAGGIAFLNSFNSELDIPVFSFNGQRVGGSNVAGMTVSHEVGHALGLRHDGDANNEYYRGHGTGETSWGPIMGAPFDKNVTQWSQGDYFGASNLEDDLDIITTLNGFGYYPDDYGDSSLTSTNLVPQGGTTINTTYGIISQNTDRDFFNFWAGAGEINIDIDVPELGDGEPGAANLDVHVILRNAGGSIIGVFNDPDTLNSSFTTTLGGAGLYYLQVFGGSTGNPFDPTDPTGYNNYGSLGNYRITGTVQKFFNPTVDIIDATASEFQSEMEFHVTLDSPSSEDIILTLATSDGTAKAGKDYVATTAQVTIPANTTSTVIPFKVSLLNDLISEPLEYFNVTIVNVVQGNLEDISDVGVGTILDNDDPLVLYTSIDRDQVGEQEGPRAAKATVERNGDLTEPLTVQIVNTDDTELYVPKTLFFPVGVDSVEFDIETVNDGAIDGTQAGVTLYATAPFYSSITDSIDVLDDDRASTRTLGGHLYEPIAPFNNYQVLLDIIVDPGRVLNIQSSPNVGTNLKFAPGTGLYIEGAVVANAENNLPITFTDQSNRDNEPGPWAGIFYSAEDQANSLFANTRVHKAINAFSVYGTDLPKLRVIHSEIFNNVENGFEVSARNGDDINEDEVEILYNKIYDNGENAVLVTSFNNELQDSRSAPLIEGNDIYGHEFGAGVYLMATTSLNVNNPDKAESIVAPRIYANSIHNNKEGIVGKSTRAISDQNYTVVAPIAHNNLIVHNDGNAIDLQVSSIYGLLNADIINNTIADNPGAAIYHSNMTDVSFSIRNNIIARNGSGIVASGPYTPLIESVMRNLVWSNNGQNWVNYPAQFGSLTSFNVNRTPSDPEKNISGDPNFLGPDNYQIRDDSIAINAGTRFEDDVTFGGYEGVEAPRVDFFGNARDYLRDLGYHEASESAFPYFEDYQDQAAQFFLPVNNNHWSVVPGPNGNYSYEANTSGLSGLGVSVLGFMELPQDFDLSVEMKAVTGSNRWYDGFIVFDYKSPTDFKYAGMLAGQNQWIVGRYQGNWGNRYASIDWDNQGRKIERDRAYEVHLRVVGNKVELSVDGERIISKVIDGVSNLNLGRVGLANYNGVTQFDNFRLGYKVNHGRTFEEVNELFGVDIVGTPVIPPNFTTNNPAKWSAVDLGGDVVLEANTVGAPAGQKLATVLVGLEGTLSSSFRIESEINTSIAPAGWSDAFIIFDYKNANDFKYAGMFSGQNEWVIGHYQGNFANRIITVDWDDTGRDIVNGQKYDVRIDVVDNLVTLFVDDEMIAEATFTNQAILNIGEIGLATYNARSRFHDFRAKDITPGASEVSSDLAFAAGDLGFLFDDEEEDQTFAEGRNTVV